MYNLNLKQMKVLRVIMSLMTAALFAGAVYMFVSFHDSEGAKTESPVVASFTTSPDIPRAIIFCGEKVDLTRYNMREGMDRELSSFTYFHSTTMLLIKRANRYFPIIEPILEKHDIPDDFKYLAVIESHLDPRATSPARAAGVWQFMSSTAKSYGLRINTSVDERRNVVKSTEAACKYLRDAYRKYGDWVAVASSYNAGMGRISGELSQQRENSVLNLYLVKETTRYPYRIFAAKQIFENPYRYGFVLHPENLYRPIHCKKIEVHNDVADLVAFAKKHGITYSDLRYFNPWLKGKKLTTGKGRYEMLIPDENDLHYKAHNTYVHDERWVVK